MARTYEDRKFSLRTLLLAMLIPVLLAALWSPVIRQMQQDGLQHELVAASLFGGVIGLILGVYFGLSHYRKLAGLFWSVPLGLIVGGLGAPLMIADADTLGTFFVTTLLAGVVLVAGSLWLSKRWYLKRLADLEGEERPGASGQ